MDADVLESCMDQNGTQECEGGVWLNGAVYSAEYRRQHGAFSKCDMEQNDAKAKNMVPAEGGGRTEIKQMM